MMTKTNVRVDNNRKYKLLLVICTVIIAWLVYMNGYVKGSYYVIDSNGEIISERGYENVLGTVIVGDSCFWVLSLSNRFSRETIFVVDENGAVIRKGKAGKDGLEYDEDAKMLKFRDRFVFMDENGEETFLAPDNMQVVIRGELKANAGDLILFNYTSNGNEKPLYGYVNRRGDVVIEPQYTYARPFAKGGLAVAQPIGGKVGYINCEGEFIIPAIYDDGFSFFDGIAEVTQDGKSLYIDSNGNVIFQSNDDYYITSFCEGYATVTNQNDKYAYMDKNGMFITDFIFDFAGDFVNGLALVKVDDKEFFIDTSGNTVIESKFQDVSPFANNGLARAKGDNGLWGYINTKGEWAIEPKYAWAFTFESKSAVVKINEN